MVALLAERPPDLEVELKHGTSLEILTGLGNGSLAQSWFRLQKIRPARVISVDREDVTRQLIVVGTGIGLLHADTAAAAKASGEVELLFESPERVQVRFAHLASAAAIRC